MRLWPYQLFPYLPDRQFRGQLRESLAIMRSWKLKGKTNSLIINNVMNYPKEEFYSYFIYYCEVYYERYNKEIKQIYKDEFKSFCNSSKLTDTIFKDWFNNEYIKICMTNLYEKYKYGIGRSRISENEWEILLNGYKTITGLDYEL